MTEKQYPEPRRFTKKPVTIEAIQYTEAIRDAHLFDGAPLPDGVNIPARTLHPRTRTAYSADAFIETLEGRMRVDIGDWIIKGVKGEFYPCKPDIFEATYVDADRAMRAGEPEAPREYVCPTETVADLVNNLLLLDQTLPIYAAQSITHDGKRRTITAPPIVSRERVKEGRWIGEGEELNAAVIWTRAAQPDSAAVALPSDEDIAALRQQYGITSNGRGIKEFSNVADFTRAVLDRWGSMPAIHTAPSQDAELAIKQCLDMGETFRALRRVVNLLLEARGTLGPEDHELREQIDALLKTDAARAQQEKK